MFDYGFLGGMDDEETLAVQVARDRKTQMLFAHVVPRKGMMCIHGAEEMEKDIDKLGHKEIILKSDGEERSGGSEAQEERSDHLEKFCTRRQPSQRSSRAGCSSFGRTCAIASCRSSRTTRCGHSKITPCDDLARATRCGLHLEVSGWRRWQDGLRALERKAFQQTCRASMKFVSSHQEVRS